MRQDIIGIKADIGALSAGVDAVRTSVSNLETRFSGLETRFCNLERDVTDLKTVTRNIAITVSRHEEHLARIDKRLEKLDEFDGIKKVLDAIMVEVIASRRERTLRDKSFSDQQEILTDHELRLTRIELRKPS